MIMSTSLKRKTLRLQKIFSKIPSVKIEEKFKDLEITGIAIDSRKVGEDFLFGAMKGANADGGQFIGSAIKSGARVILCDIDSDIAVPDSVCLIKHENPRRVFSLIAAEFYDKQPEVIAAVTGTNGKTSTVHFCREIWKNLGKESASIGTVGIYNDKVKFDNSGASLTTPDPVKLHESLAKLADSGITHLAMEASSHGLSQYRLDGVKVKVAAFSNLTRDHLDYHGTFENYLQAKLRLFDEVMEDGGVAVLNADVPEYSKIAEICKKRHHKIISYGLYGKDKQRNYIDIFKIVPTSDGQQISFEILGKVYNINTHLIGEFQAYNILCALAMVLASGCNVDEAVAAIPHITCVPGRMEKVMVPSFPSSVFVDYAHTPDALEKAIKVLRPHTKGKLWVVFGCGGDRDKGKRPLMGEVAFKFADNVIVTDDNPRSEKPETIRKEILAACKNAEEIGDRHKAIEKAISLLQKGDSLLIAGKGHEKTQTVGNDTFPFDDVVVSKEVMEKIRGKNA